ncbi:MAG: hypothetical protein ABWY25_04660 [Paenisporosarcina sp.]
MNRSWLRILLAPLVIISLVGCSASLENQTEDGIEEAKEVFQGETIKPNEQFEKVQFYVPGGFDILEESDESNIVLSDDQDSFVLFINPNEKQDSHLFYDLLLAEKKDMILAEKTFEQNGRFGFVALLPSGKEHFEIIVSSGGYKLSTISDKNKIAENMQQMMEIVRSVKIEK